jgi:MarR family transcriptional regulator, 2-MHQ and catechol-resistance regulon repressor
MAMAIDTALSNFGADPGNDRDAILIAELILDTATRLRKALGPSLDEELGRLAPSFGILLQLKLAPGGLLRMSDLAAQTGFTSSGLTRAVDRLEEAGLVRREACPTDRRGAYAVLTELGHHQTALAMTRHRRDIEEMLRTTFSASDEDALVHLMQKLRDRVYPEAEPLSVALTGRDRSDDDWSHIAHVTTLAARSEIDEDGDAGAAEEEPCGICESVSGASGTSEFLYEDEHWVVRHVSAPYGVAGWMTMYSRRHVAGIAYFDAAESASFGPTLSRLQEQLEKVTGALRIYTLSLGESLPHFHTHMVPRYEETPGGVSGWDLFELLPQATEGKVVVDPREVERICTAYRASLAS